MALPGGPTSDRFDQSLLPGRAWIEERLCRYGTNSFCGLLLDPGVRHHRLASVDGFVGYLESTSLAMSLGEPVCAPADFGVAAREFVESSAERGKDCAFALVGDAFMRALDGDPVARIGIGDDFIFDVQTYAPAGNRARKVRSAVHQVARKGAVVKEYAPRPGLSDTALERAILDVASRWRARRRARASGHVLGLNLFDAARPRRYFYTVIAGRIVAFLSCMAIPARKGFLFEDLVRDPLAPNGCSELMILEALARFRAEGIEVATLGISPRPDVDKLVGVSAWSRWLARRAVQLAEPWVGLRALHHHRAKFDTRHVERVWLVKYPPRFRLRDVYGIMRMFNVVG